MEMSREVHCEGDTVPNFTMSFSFLSKITAVLCAAGSMRTIISKRSFLMSKYDEIMDISKRYINILQLNSHILSKEDLQHNAKRLVLK